jgi:cytochrome c oxidase cbb3-type subunit III
MKTTRAVAVVLLLFAGCKREDRAFRVSPAAVARDPNFRLTELQAGPASGPQPSPKNNYEENAYAMSEGKRLFVAFNCTGCHANGGGAIGPALMDDKWRYGNSPEHIFASIMEGRPNGMPSFRGKLNEHQAWQITGYVRSLGGLVRKDAAPARDDHMKTSPPPNSVDPVKPVVPEPPPKPQ